MKYAQWIYLVETSKCPICNVKNSNFPSKTGFKRIFKIRTCRRCCRVEKHLCKMCSRKFPFSESIENLFKWKLVETRSFLVQPECDDSSKCPYPEPNTCNVHVTVSVNGARPLWSRATFFIWFYIRPFMAEDRRVYYILYVPGARVNAISSCNENVREETRK